jgi:hypothetical protein
MKPINSKERARAFFRVTVWFVICFTLAMLLGYCTMNVKNYSDSESRKQLESLKSELSFMGNVFQPNIESATRQLENYPSYREKNLNRDDIATNINVSLENIKKEWKVDEKDQQYLMYKNIVDVYFTLKSTYDKKFKLEEELESKDNAVKNGSGDVQRLTTRIDELERENQSLKSEKSLSGPNSAKLQSQLDKLQSQLISCRDSLKRCIREVSILRQK